MKQFPLAPTSLIYKTLREKDIKVNGIRIKEDVILHAGDRVTVYFSDERAQSLGFKPQKNGSIGGPSVVNSNAEKSAGNEKSANIARYSQALPRKGFPKIPVVYQDEQILVLNKPVGVLSQKDSPQSYSLTEYLKDQYSDESGFAPAIVNRLDRNTSGIVIAGCSFRSLQQLNEMIRFHRGEKAYLAVIHGNWKKEQQAYVVHRWQKDSTSNKAKVKRIFAGPELPQEYRYLLTMDETSSGQKSDPVSSHFSNETSGEFQSKGTAVESLVLCKVEGISDNPDQKMSLVKLYLYTGKSHQLRSQLAELGYPIAGDPKYSEKASGTQKRGADTGISHQLLHAWCYRMEGLRDGLEYLNGQSFYAAPDREFTHYLKILFPEWEKQI